MQQDAVERPRGHETKEATAWCAFCPNWVQEDAHTMTYFRKVVKRYGWRYTSKFGWVCQHCVDADRINTWTPEDGDQWSDVS